jgi:hypothetical protein
LPIAKWEEEPTVLPHASDIQKARRRQLRRCAESYLRLLKRRHTLLQNLLEENVSNFAEDGAKGTNSEQQEEMLRHKKAPFKRSSFP